MPKKIDYIRVEGDDYKISSDVRVGQTESSASFCLTDDNGYVGVQLDKGHIRTKYFDSKKDLQIESEREDVTSQKESSDEGYVDNSAVGSTIKYGAFSKHSIYRVPSNTEVTINIDGGGLYKFAITDLNNIVLEIVGTSQTESEYTFNVRDVECLLQVSDTKIKNVFFKSADGKSLKEQVSDNTKDIEELKSASATTSNYWTNKLIWWCGTSIPAGSDATLGSEETVAGMYPKQVGVNLNARVANEAVGGSMCRANVRTGDYNGVNPSNLTSCLSRTKAEIADLIANYDTYKALPLNSNWSASLSASDLSRLNSSSFEDKLLPYLDGVVSTKNPLGEIPSLFVIDHSHNDYKYQLADGTTDIKLEPTAANITAGVLTEDTYMTANNYERLAYFFNCRSASDSTKGDGAKLVQRVGVSKMANFVASVNRNCYIGAINFIMTVILCKLPKARFVFISNYEYQNGDSKGYAPLIEAQEMISKSWAFPLCEVYKFLGFSDHIVPTAPEYFLDLYRSVPGSKVPSQVQGYIDNNVGCNVFRLYNHDAVHPHSDISGDANTCYAGIISEFLKMCR